MVAVEHQHKDGTKMAKLPVMRVLEHWVVGLRLQEFTRMEGERRVPETSAGAGKQNYADKPGPDDHLSGQGFIRFRRRNGRTIRWYAIRNDRGDVANVSYNMPRPHTPA
jgi:hypothetical protein